MFLHPITLLGSVAASFRSARRYEHLFAMSDAELNRRGLNREELVRGFISGMAHS
jgi:hypothetical protein